MSEALKGIDLELAKYEQALQNLKDDLIAKIRDLPDNPKIHRVKESPHCFIMRFKDLGDCWSPEYHDFKYQYEVIIEMIEKKNIKQLKTLFEKILSEGRVYYESSNGRNEHKFHPEVVEMLRRL